MRIPGAGRTPDRAAARSASVRGSRDTAAARPGARAKAKAALVAAAAGTALAVLLSGCGGDSGSGGGDSASGKPSAKADRTQDPTKIPGVGDGLQKKIPAQSTQVVAVEGKGKDSADATLRLYTRQAAGAKWEKQHAWPAHNGRKGWTGDHREGDKRSPVGVFSLSDAGGVLAAPGARLPYTQTVSFTPPAYWPEKKRHDFDHVIAVDYNRIKGTTPLDPTRPQGKAKGGSIWLHMDHGDGTSGCVSISRSGMETLLRTLDPDRHPVVVMGDKRSLAA